MDTIRNIGGDVYVVPLSNKFNRNFMGLDANGETPVSCLWVNGSSVDFQIERPTLASREIDTAVVPTTPRVLNPADFMRGGGLG